VPRYVAFLRAVNVGGRVVKMDRLSALFAKMAFDDVRTFIASGNVLFASPAKNGAALEPSIEQRLERALGYPVAAFVRSMDEMARLVEHPLVAGVAARQDGAALYVAFTRRPLGRDATRKLLSFNDEMEQFHVHDRHVFWLLRQPFHQSRVSGALLERTIGMPATVRNSTTLRRLVQKFGEDS